MLAIRRGSSLRRTARRFDVSLGTVQHWLARAAGERLSRVDFSTRQRGPRKPANRTTAAMERRILALRRKLANSPLGECGAAAIRAALLKAHRRGARRIASLRTIGRILLRNGVLDGRRRVRRMPPPKGWYLPEVSAGKVELDSFDTITDLRIAKGSMVTVLNGISLHGGLAASWPQARITSKFTGKALLEHWRRFGLPAYVKFDNDTIFQGAHHWPDAVGRVIRLCLALGVTAVFAPPNRQGFQAEIEAFNGRWQRQVWRRRKHKNLKTLQADSQRFIRAHRRRHAGRIEGAPERPAMPKDFRMNWRQPLRGKVIYLRYTDEAGSVKILGRRFLADRGWASRLVRVEVDFTASQVRIWGLRRREPSDQRLLKTHVYRHPQKPFLGGD